MRPTRLAAILLTALALPGVAGATPIARIACTIDSTDGTTRKTVSTPSISTLIDRPAEISVRAGASETHPAHTLRLKLKPTAKTLEAEAHIEVDGQTPIVKAVHIQNNGQWVDLNIVGTFRYLVDCKVDRDVQAPPAPAKAPD